MCDVCRVCVPCIALHNGLARHDHEQAEDAVEVVEVFQRSFRPMRIRTWKPLNNRELSVLLITTTTTSASGVKLSWELSPAAPASQE